MHLVENLCESVHGIFVFVSFAHQFEFDSVYRIHITAFVLHLDALLQA